MITMATDDDNDNIMVTTLYLRMYPQLLHHRPRPALLDPDHNDSGQLVAQLLLRVQSAQVADGHCWQLISNNEQDEEGESRG